MKKIIKILFINFLILFLGIFIIELVMGGWFIEDKKLDNLNIMRDIDYVFQADLYTRTPVTIHYSRDKFGLRGKSTFNRPEQIDILTVGGSTTVQGYITDGETWQDVLENCFQQSGKEVLVSNSGIDGQSTFGHIKNFEVWFPQIPDLKPKYIIFYVGINDFYRISENGNYDDLLGNYSLVNKFKTNSVVYNFLRTVKGIITAEKVKVGHRKTDFSKLDYTDKGIATEELYKLYKINLEGFETRIKKLIKYTEAIGAEPIFVTQPSIQYKWNEEGHLIGISNKKLMGNHAFNGVDYFNLLNELNELIKKVCRDKYTVIELTNLPIWEEEDFYDLYHNTPQGAKKVGVEIFKQIKDK